MAAHPPLKIGHQVVVGHGLAGDDDGAGYRLAPFLAGNADDRGIAHRAVREQHVLDLAGRHVLAAAHDHVVRAPVEEQVALVVLEPGIAGRKPALGVHRAAAVLVFARDLLAAHVDLAALAGGKGLALVVADFEFDAGQRDADGDQPASHRFVFAGGGGTVLVGAEHGDRGTRLGESVGVGEVRVGEQRHGLLDHG